MIKNVLFDLDGTLLPMDLPRFIELYLSAFCSRFSKPLGIDPKTLTKGIWDGAGAMAHNDGSCLNCDLFWREMNRVCGRDMTQYEADFDDFYRTDFDAAKAAVGLDPCAAKSVEYLKNKGCRLILATNPVFPESAVFARLKWAGVDPDDFEFITLNDTCTVCKPNPEYYLEICQICGILPEESLMVGNDVDEDMCAADVGFNVFLVTDCLINRRGVDISKYPNGSLREFYSGIKRNY